MTSILSKLRTFFVTAETDVVNAIHNVEGVVESFESTVTGGLVANALQNSSVGSKIENLISEAEAEGRDLIAEIPSIASKIEADVEAVEGFVGNVKSAALALAATAVNDWHAVI